MGCRSSNKTVYPAKYHVVWCPKYRRQVLGGGRSSRLLRAELAHLHRPPPLWSPAWLVSTVGRARPEVARRHVENQKRAG